MPTVYKVCERASWRAAEAAGQYLGSPADQRDGFIHLSTAAQLAETVAKHFAQQRDLVLIAADAQALAGQLRWEPSRHGDLFPHLYGPLPVQAARWVRSLPDEAHGHRPLGDLDP